MAKDKDQPDDYLVGGYFGVEIDGITGAVFRGADGLTVHREVVEYQEGGENAKTHKLVGQTRWSNIVLRAGMTADDDFFQWMKKTVDGTVERKNGAVIFFDRAGLPKLRWDFTNGFICRWEGPRFDSLQSEITIEVVEIAHDGFQMKKC
ncbi:MAG TPA: phage tail protein [Planctomycetota bacterium]|jgi:phage tail-like protein|nr:phage tail protein [Planctomycetota bacterium]